VVTAWKRVIFGQHQACREQVTIAAQNEESHCSPADPSLSKSWKVHLADAADGTLICFDSLLKHTAIRR
jgi:hypothetical protein